MKKLTALLAATALFGAAPAFAVTTIPVAPGTGNTANCFPFTCNFNGTYQQVYASSAFTGPLTFDTLTFFANQSFPGITNTGNYAISLYYSANPVDGLSATFANNRGALIGSLGSFALSGQALNGSSPLSFTGALINYNPSLGNLLLDVSATTIVGGSSFMDAQSTADSISRASIGTDTLGLVTRFSLTAAPAVPEPTTWMLMLIGMAGVGFSMRRKKDTTVRVHFA